MKNKWMTMILVLSLAMNSAVLAVAGYHYYTQKRRHSETPLHAREGEHHFFQKLELTPDQLAKMTSLAHTFHKDLNRLHAEMDTKKSAMIDLLSGENASPANIDELRKEMAALQDSIQKIVIDHVLDVKEVLNSRQRKRFFELVSKSMHQEPEILIREGKE